MRFEEKMEEDGTEPRPGILAGKGIRRLFFLNHYQNETATSVIN